MPLDLRIGGWLCILPATTLVVDKSQKVNNAASSDWLVNSQTHKMEGSTVAFPVDGVSGDNEWLPHYISWSRSKSVSKSLIEESHNSKK